MKIEDAINLVIVDKLKGLIVSNDMVATGALLNSIRVEKSERAGVITYSILALNYIEDLNYGVPGKVNPDFTDFEQDPLIHKLEQWIEAKGLDLNPFAVRANILKYGTTWHRLGGSNIVTDSINDEAFNRIFELAKDDIRFKIKKTTQVLFTQPTSFDVALDEGYFD